VSLCVQASSSSQLAPLALGGSEHTPVAGSQTPASWHWSSGLQTTGKPAVQEPAWHASLTVHALPSSQLAPSAFAGLEQAPVEGSQTPAS
jgi:hypothetical protein